MWSGYSGLLFCSSADILPADTLQVSALLLGHLEAVGSSLNALFPVQVGLRLTAIENLEVAAQAMVILKNYAESPLSASVTGKYRFLSIGARNGLTMAATVKGTYVSDEYTDTITNFTGVSLGLPAQLTIGKLHFFLMPDIHFSPFEVSYNIPSEPDFYTWMYGRAGISLDLGSISTGISAALRTASFNRGLAVQWPLAAGWEIHWLLPDTQVLLSASVAGEFVPVAPTTVRDPGQGFYLMGGIGIGFFN
jgi:hypothetical protein